MEWVEGLEWGGCGVDGVGGVGGGGIVVVGSGVGAAVGGLVEQLEDEFGHVAGLAVVGLGGLGGGLGEVGAADEAGHEAEAVQQLAGELEVDEAVELGLGDLLGGEHEGAGVFADGEAVAGHAGEQLALVGLVVEVAVLAAGEGGGGTAASGDLDVSASGCGWHGCAP
ncbi:MAG TPA: hypothetical protein VK473_02485 [Terriglobales bacterium]|nr:hypothetical protein [Terriglobales bacterium]